MVAGPHVTARQPVVVMEAKTETSLAAPRDAMVSAVQVKEREAIAGGALLVEFDATDEQAETA